MQPIFDTQGSFSIGWATVDMKRPNVVWVGAGDVPAIERELDRLGAPYTPGRTPRDPRE
jgi:hypothetical protein